MTRKKGRGSRKRGKGNKTVHAEGAVVWRAVSPMVLGEDRNRVAISTACGLSRTASTGRLRKVSDNIKNVTCDACRRVRAEAYVHKSCDDSDV